MTDKDLVPAGNKTLKKYNQSRPGAGEVLQSWSEYQDGLGLCQELETMQHIFSFL